MALIRTTLLALCLGGLAPGARAASWDQDLQNCAGGPPDLAITACTAMIKNWLEPADAKSIALNNRAKAHIRKSEYDLAMADLNAAIALKPDYPEAFYNRGIVFNDGMSLPRRAIDDYSAAIAIRAKLAAQPAKRDAPPPPSKDFPEALNDRGLAYDGLGQYDAAVKDFSAALKANPRFGAALANRGAAYAKLRNYSAALADDDAALRLDPTQSSRWSARCWARLKAAVRPGLAVAAAFGQAQSDCRQALALDAGNLDARNAQALIKLIENDDAGAVKDFQSALTADPKNSLALFGRGVAKRALGDSTGGEADMTAARRAAPLVTGDFWEVNLIPTP